MEQVCTEISAYYIKPVKRSVNKCLQKYNTSDKAI